MHLYNSSEQYLSVLGHLIHSQWQALTKNCDSHLFKLCIADRMNTKV